MPHWSDSIERQIIMAMAQRRNESGHFDPESSGQLWAWQGRRRISIKETLGLELPGVYTPPLGQVLQGDKDNPSLGQTWQVETEKNNFVKLFLKSPKKTDSSAGFVIRVFDSLNSESQEAFCSAISETGMTGVALGLRGANSPERILELAEIYLGLGRCYGETITIDLMRIVDHLENEAGAEGEPIVLVLSGFAIPVGLAYASIDQRISGLIIDYTDAPQAIIEPTGTPPFFLASYAALGPNPPLVMLQCCAPRPMTIIGSPEKVNEIWMTDPVAGVLSFADQLTILKRTYKNAGNSERLTIIDRNQPRPQIKELAAQILSQCA